MGAAEAHPYVLLEMIPILMAGKRLTWLVSALTLHFESHDLLLPLLSNECCGIHVLFEDSAAHMINNVSI